MVTLPRMPKRIERLPPDERGYPVPWFVAWLDGKPEFRVADAAKFRRAINEKLCWVCGERLDDVFAFVIGPMCALNRTIGEPPSHITCAEFSAKACPFLSRPKAQRRDANMPDEGRGPAGIAITRNPGVCCLWVCRSYRVFNPGNGILFKLPDPEGVMWFCEGRTATREEIQHSIDTGFPILNDIAQQEGPEAVSELQRHRKRAELLLPV